MQKLLNEFLTRRGNRPKILLVDDQIINIQVLHELFQKHCDVFVAMNGEQAISECHTNVPDLVLLDVEMPGMSGIEVCQQLKSSSCTKDIPVIFLTAYNSDQEQLQAFEAGAMDIIGKPFNSVIVLARVCAHLMLKLQADLFKSIAFVDALTGIANRRHFDEESVRLWKQAIRHKQPISLLMIDVDYFKLYNDSNGHAKGDLCLLTIAQSLKDELRRPLDLMARYGGEEFVCVLPDTDFEGAQHIAENMLRNIRALAIPHPTSGLEEKLVSVSIGAVSLIPSPCRNLMFCIEEADKQLYQAKISGRGRFCALNLQNSHYSCDTCSMNS